MTFPPITDASEVRDLFPEAIEVAVWLDFGDHETLTAAARLLGAELTPGVDVPEAEPGRHLYATVWPVTPETLQDAPDEFLLEGDELALKWTNAYLLGIVRAAVLLAMAGKAGIGGRVYAIRVQPEGAVFPATYQTGDAPERVQG